jgi:hypothetical protein
LCSGDVNFDILSQARQAVYGYNHSSDYVTLVLSIAASYDEGVVDVVSNDDPPSDTDPNPNLPDPLPNPGPNNPGPNNPGPNNPGPNNPGPNNPGPHNPGPNNPGPNNPGPNNPGPNNPGPNNPGPNNPGPNNPGPTPNPPEGPNPGPNDPGPNHPDPHPNPPEGPNPGPNPDPDPEPEPEPEPTVLTGTLSECADEDVTTWCLVSAEDGSEAPLALGDERNLGTSQGDYDADGAVELVIEELTGLYLHRDVEAREVIIGLDADGVIVAIQEIPFSVVSSDETPTGDQATEEAPLEE